MGLSKYWDGKIFNSSPIICGSTTVLNCQALYALTQMKLHSFESRLVLYEEFPNSLRCMDSCSPDGSKVFEVVVRTVANFYQAGSTVVFLRVSQGSAVITTHSQNGERQR